MPNAAIRPGQRMQTTQSPRRSWQGIRSMLARRTTSGRAWRGVCSGSRPSRPCGKHGRTRRPSGCRGEPAAGFRRGPAAPSGAAWPNARTAAGKPGRARPRCGGSARGAARRGGRCGWAGWRRLVARGLPGRMHVALEQHPPHQQPAVEAADRASRHVPAPIARRVPGARTAAPARGSSWRPSKASAPPMPRTRPRSCRVRTTGLARKLRPASTTARRPPQLPRPS